MGKFWKLLQDLVSLLTQIYHAKYLKEGESILDAQYTTRQSWGWKIVMNGGEIIRKHIKELLLMAQ